MSLHGLPDMMGGGGEKVHGWGAGRGAVSVLQDAAAGQGPGAGGAMAPLPLGADT